MLRPQLHQTSTPVFLLPNPFFHGNTHTRLPVFPKSSSAKTKVVRARNIAGKIKARATEEVNELSTKVKTLITVKKSGGFPNSILIQLVSSRSGPAAQWEHAAVKLVELQEISYEADLVVPYSFGEAGAIYVQNTDSNEMFIKSIQIDGNLNFVCDSWVQPNATRIFFTAKSYLPSETPDGLKQAREQELEILRGNGVGERQKGERIYDYDVYNDLGDPDSDPTLGRPVLGGKEFPYPRRCRTGRPRCKTDENSESKVGINDTVYVPRDEEFSEVKIEDFEAQTYGLAGTIDSSDPEFDNFSAIDSLFKEGIKLKFGSDITTWKFETPQTLKRDEFFWLKDEQFGRETLAGTNPMSIQLITDLPLMSKLDPKVYGPPESAITKELIAEEIKEFMTVEEAVKGKKLFILDYHDMFLPYVSKVSDLPNATLYGSRTVFFLTPENTLRPLAIELVQPPMGDKPQWKKVFQPTAAWESTDYWLWKLAKAHVVSHDSIYQQLVSHWLRTHCCAEPYAIAGNRQLSVMHPIYKLLHPHFRYTMALNGIGRQTLVNAEGVIESTFTAGTYSMEISSIIYKEQWRFDLQALPADLISRGMAVEDSNEPHGLKLTIEDYPFASDGLILWDAIRTWVTDYVNHYYPDSTTVSSDKELQAFWDDIRNVGHADKKDEKWWPELSTLDDLIKVLTIIIWTASALHASVNFGQYAYSGYFPNRPTITRRKIPEKGDIDWKVFIDTPEKVLLETLPPKSQAVKVMIALHALANHSPDEEYLGKESEISWVWGLDPEIKAAFEKFQKSLGDLETIIDERNADPKLRNRNGIEIIPYELLKLSSEAGVTGKGVPYSISI